MIIQSQNQDKPVLQFKIKDIKVKYVEYKLVIMVRDKPSKIREPTNEKDYLDYRWKK